MILRRASDGVLITIEGSDQIGSGGEARIVTVPQYEGSVAKIYHVLEPHRGRKLAAMLANPPHCPQTRGLYASIAWPEDLLIDPSNHDQIVGYMMPRVLSSHALFLCYNPSARRKQRLPYDYRSLHRIARNVASCVHSVHSRGYTIGDLNESNLLVAANSLVTLVDTDSFQFLDVSTGEIFRCPVGKPEFTPPELQDMDFSGVTRSLEHDQFGLAVLIFQILMEGLHPYGGIYRGLAEPPPYAERIAKGHFVYGARTVPYAPMRTAMPYETLSPRVARLFARCFEDGHAFPSMRPTAFTWAQALDEAEKELVTCDTNGRHWFGNHLDRCPWCQRRTMLGGRDPFPDRPMESYPEPVKRVRRSSDQKAMNLGRKTTSAPGGGTSFFARRASAAHYSGSLLQSSVQSVTVASSQSISNSASGGPTASPRQQGGFPYSGPGPSAASPPAVIIVFPRNPWAWWSAVAAAASIAGYIVTAPFLSVCGLISAPVLAALSWKYAPRFGGTGRLIGLSAAFSAVLAGAPAMPGLFTSLHGLPTSRVFSANSGGIRALSFSRDGALIAAASLRAEDQRLIGGQLNLWDAADGRLVENLAEFEDSVVSVDWDSKSGQIVVARDSPMGAGSVSLLKAHEIGWQRPLVSGEPYLSSVRFSPDHKLIAYGGSDGVVSLCDADTLAEVRSFHADGAVTALAWDTIAPDRLYIATTSASGSIKPGTLQSWETRLPRMRWRRNTHGNGVTALSTSSDGVSVATGGNDGCIRIWNSRDGKLVRFLDTTGFRIPSIAISPDGAEVAGADIRVSGEEAQCEVHVWSVATGAIERTFHSESGIIQAMAWSPDGRMLVTGSSDSSIRTFKMH